MTTNSGIEWTDATWNPTVGCTKISSGCKHCYAATMHKRLTAMRQPKYSEPFGVVRPWEPHLAEPLRWRKPRMIFVDSMSDLFHRDVPDDYIRRVFDVMVQAKRHTFQVLTKRSDRLREMAPSLPWPSNVWMGVSVESAEYLHRVNDLATVQAEVRFLSLEPLLGALDLRPWLEATWCTCGAYTPGPLEADVCAGCGNDESDGFNLMRHPRSAIGWVIAGGENASEARPMHPAWVRDLRDQCVAARVPFFFKQWGTWGPSGVFTATGAEVFRQFDTFQTWVNKASTWMHKGDICMDATGRRLRNGGDMMRARDEGTFPATILAKLGKAEAGRILDGQTWDEMPRAFGPAIGGQGS